MARVDKLYKMYNDIVCSIIRYLGYERVYMPLCKVADRPFHIQGDDMSCNLCNRIMEKAKANLYANIILENSEDPKKLWKSINNILHRFPPPSLPENLSLKTICEKFSNFFVDKITIIRSKFPDDNELRNVYPSYDIIFLMNTLTLATEAEIKKLTMKSKSTSSDLDPFPTSLLKDCLDVLIEPITSIINKSLQKGVFPDQFKKAYIRPLLKKKL